jgi:hypothetical protein
MPSVLRPLKETEWSLTFMQIEDELVFRAWALLDFMVNRNSLLHATLESLLLKLTTVGMERRLQTRYTLRLQGRRDI